MESMVYMLFTGHGRSVLENTVPKVPDGTAFLGAVIGDGDRKRALILLSGLPP